MYFTQVLYSYTLLKYFTHILDSYTLLIHAHVPYSHTLPMYPMIYALL